MEHLIQDHLRQSVDGSLSIYAALSYTGDALQFDGLSALPDLLRDVFDLDDRVGLDDPEQILLQQGVVQRGQMCADSRVGREF